MTLLLTAALDLGSGRPDPYTSQSFWWTDEDMSNGEPLLLDKRSCIFAQVWCQMKGRPTEFAALSSADISYFSYLGLDSNVLYMSRGYRREDHILVVMHSFIMMASGITSQLQTHFENDLPAAQKLWEEVPDDVRRWKTQQDCPNMPDQRIYGFRESTMYHFWTVLRQGGRSDQIPDLA
ncbi:hypothetical protein FISHEDRAFT_60959 [Fistulina hepatica ATCC 64428]|uniref:Uncharacterized protein n=1 Tax=Fistulina hepatica ATCC 64428 TaxID=1128425 RepID=A0A0D7A418_9AGAR|nr:hypothetical protein FISHEDRAFT_60959 [Fistulina hepatica ATCC 64428]